LTDEKCKYLTHSEIMTVFIGADTAVFCKSEDARSF